MGMAEQIAFEKGFSEELSALYVSAEEGLERLIYELPEDDALELGRRAARYALAPLLWRAVAGEVWDTTQVTEFLEVSRQALNKRVRHHSLLALPGRGVTYFPTWQFDLDRRMIRPIIKDVLAAFCDARDEVDPYVVLSWSRSPQHEELDGLTPQEWIHKGGNDAALILAAKRAAAALAA